VIGLVIYFVKKRWSKGLQSTWTHGQDKSVDMNMYVDKYW
jgi:hypothetical protein